MKKFAMFFLSLVLMLSLAACGADGGKNAEGQSSQTENDSAALEDMSEPSGTSSEASSKTSDGAGNGKTLVVYYSATNNTKEVAGYIAAATDGELFEIVPTEPYSSDDLNWSDSGSRVSKEHDDPSLRKVELENTVPENWKDYDTVFIGYPIWWGIAAWPVDGFISANDFSGKTVIPFCTSSSSGLGESGELLEKAAGTGDWLDGERFQSGASEETVQDWVKGLGLK